MGFVEKKWEMSNEVAGVTKEWKSLEPGVQDLLIKDAWIENDNVYILRLESINADDEENPPSSEFRYWLNSTDQNGNIVKNVGARNTLITLGEALAGKCIGIPEPSSVVGGVVHAEIKLGKPNANGQRFLRIYKYEPVPEELALCALIDQYYIGAPVE